MSLKPGDIALCCAGWAGLILKVSKRKGEVPLHTGIHLSKERFGDEWQSYFPWHCGTIHRLLETNDAQASREGHEA